MAAGKRTSQFAARAPERTPVLFEPGRGRYSYAPCLVESQADRLRHVYYGGNRTPGEVTDHICVRRGELRLSRWVWGDEQIALAPASSRSAWDSRHVCDPDLVHGLFKFSGETWTFALFYLGCDAEGSTHNQVGMAFSQSLVGPWCRYPKPVIAYRVDARGGKLGERYGWPLYTHWGVGQPSVVSLDRAGKVLVLFSRGEERHGEEMAIVGMADLDRGATIVDRRRMPMTGLKRSDGQATDYCTNAAIAIDDARGRCYAVRDGELPPADGRFPGFISSYIQVAWIDTSSLIAGRGAWSVLANIGPETTGWPRNHNATILKDTLGRVPDPHRLTIALSVAEAYDTPPLESAWLWTYRIATLDLAAPRP